MFLKFGICKLENLHKNWTGSGEKAYGYCQKSQNGTKNTSSDIFIEKFVIRSALPAQKNLADLKTRIIRELRIDIDIVNFYLLLDIAFCKCYYKIYGCRAALF